MGETREEFISGFCRTSNETRTVVCEYERCPDGSVVMTEFGWDYEKCVNSEACLILEQARGLEKLCERVSKFS